jgi:uncharacterized protein (TIGR03790 family)
MPLLAAPSATAQTAQNVAVVINAASAASTRIGEYYVKQRAIPPANVIRIRTTDAEAIDRSLYLATIEQPIAAALARERLQDRILFIVLTKGVPLRINGTAGVEGTVSSVDSELTLLYRRMTGAQVRVTGRVDNPYYLAARDLTAMHPFSHRDYDIYLVTRLDAFTVEQALALIDKAKAPAPEGRIVLDQRDALVDRTGDNWLDAAAQRLAALGQGERVELERTPRGARDITPVIGYYSWGSTDPRNRVRTVGMGFVPGSIAATFVASDARTFKEPPPAWAPENDPTATNTFAGSAQSLAGDLIREGATGVGGNVTEPYLQNTVRPDILFPAYVSGANLAEAFYLAMPSLSWQSVVVGDPLCAPFARKPLPAADADAGLDAELQLPAFFARRRLANGLAGARGVPEATVKLSIRAEDQLARNDVRAARATLEEATAQSPAVAALQLQLALLYDQLKEHKAAVDRYRRVVQLQPDSAVALNNLAYTLATFENNTAEALPLARRAAAAAPRDGTVLDTLAWIEHLSGDDANAARGIAQAIRLAPRNADVHLHAAVINAALGARAVAEDELKEALRLNPTLATSEQVQQVRAQLQKLGTRP